MSAAESPWLRIARAAAREWFRDNPGAPWREFYQWAAEVWEPIEFRASGFGLRPGEPANGEALTAAHLGLAAAVEDEARRRAGRDVALSGHRSHGEPLAGHGASLTSLDWWNGAQRDGAA